MRFIGHLDVMRYFQKAFRRADIAVSYSQGFSPHQLMSFASPLGIGLSSDGEYLDVVLEDSVNTDTLVAVLNEQMNEEIRIKDFTVLSDEAKTSMAVLAACDYLVTVKPDKSSFLTEVPDLKKVFEAFLSQEQITILKKTKRSEKLVDIKENIYCLTTERSKFESFTKGSYETLSLDTKVYQPLFYCQLTAGSVINIKPELIIEALAQYMDKEYSALDYQIHRLEMYADTNAKKGEVHTRSSETPVQLLPLSVYEKRPS